VKNSKIKLCIIAITLLLLAGGAGAQTSCDSLANVRAWNSNVSFSYSSSGSWYDSNIPWETYHFEWTLQQSADVSFRLKYYGNDIDNISQYDLN